MTYLATRAYMPFYTVFCVVYVKKKRPHGCGRTKL